MATAQWREQRHTSGARGGAARFPRNCQRRLERLAACALSLVCSATRAYSCAGKRGVTSVLLYQAGLGLMSWSWCMGNYRQCCHAKPQRGHAGDSERPPGRTCASVSNASCQGAAGWGLPPVASLSAPEEDESKLKRPEEVAWAPSSEHQLEKDKSRRMPTSESSTSHSSIAAPLNQSSYTHTSGAARCLSSVRSTMPGFAVGAQRVMPQLGQPSLLGSRVASVAAAAQSSHDSPRPISKPLLTHAISAVKFLNSKVRVDNLIRH